MAHDVFISYAGGDKVGANALCHHLEAKGIRCWIAPRDVDAGADWTDSISEAIDACRAFVVVFTDESAKSRHVKSEVRAAFDRDKVLVPVRFQEIVPTGGFDHLLGNSHWIDAFPQPLEAYFSKVVSVLDSLLTSNSATRQDSGRVEPIAQGCLEKGKESVRQANRRGWVWALVAIAIAVTVTGLALSGRIGADPVEVGAEEGSGDQGEDAYAFSFAYVISNWRYENNPEFNLVGAKADGHAVKQALAEQGYRVLLRENVSKSGLSEIVSDLRDLERDGGTFVFYYAGSALSSGGKTYIVPSDFPRTDLTEAGAGIVEHCFKVADFLNVADDSESLVLYSAQPGELAADTAPGQNISPFAAAFNDNLGERIDVLDFAQQVSRDVEDMMKDTPLPQVPELIIGRIDKGSSMHGKGAGGGIRRFVFFDGCRHYLSDSGR